MNKNKLIASGLAASALFALSISSAGAMYNEYGNVNMTNRMGNSIHHEQSYDRQDVKVKMKNHQGDMRGRIELTEAQKTKLDSLSGDAKKEYIDTLKAEEKAKVDAMTDAERKAYMDERMKNHQGDMRGRIELTEAQKTKLDSLSGDAKKEYIDTLKAEEKAKVDAMTDAERKAYMDEKMKNHQGNMRGRIEMKNHQDDNKRQEYKGNMKNKKTLNDGSNEHSTDASQSTISNSIELKYGKILDKLSDTKLKSISVKIDSFITKFEGIENNSIQTTKIMPILKGLKIAIDKRISNKIDANTYIQSLFE